MRYFIRNSILLTLLLLASSFLLASCASKDSSPQDDEFSKWKAKAETSHPYLPQRKEFSDPPSTDEVKSKSGQEVSPDKSSTSGWLYDQELLTKLPSKPITVRFVNDGLPTVLRTLARLANQNIFISPSVEGTVNTHIKNIPWNKVFVSIITSYGLIATMEDNLLHVMSIKDIQQKIARKALQKEEEQVAPLKTKRIPIEYSTPKEILKSLSLLLSQTTDGKPRGSVSVDEHTRSLIIRDTEENMGNLLELIYDLDQPTPQILIKAQIIETSKDTARALGVKWGALANKALGDSNLTVTPGSSSYYSPQSGRLSPFQYQQQYEDENRATHMVIQNAKALEAATKGEVYIPEPYKYEVTYENLGKNLDFSVPGAMIGFLLSNKSLILDAQLSALQTSGKLNILSSPSISTLDNSEAIIKSGTSIPIPSGVDTNGNIIYTQTDATLELRVKPHVISPDQIKLEIEAKKDEVTSTEGRILKKYAQTQLIVPDSTTVVIAGLTKEVNTNSEKGVPFLKDIPILGNLFKERSKSNQFEDLLIFITPTILTQSPDKAGLQSKNTEEK